MASFKRILIANRGEIAVRIIRTAQKMGLETIAVYSEADRGAPHVRMADYAGYLGESTVEQSYLNAEKILRWAQDFQAEAIHPGYGLLSEDPSFAESCKAQNLVFIGPTAEHLRDFGLKHRARTLAEQSGAPLPPGSGLIEDSSQALREAEETGYPVMLKSTAGGGGIGMALCSTNDELLEAIERVRRLAESNFGNAGVFLEKCFLRARHLEVQIFGDGQGAARSLGVRDCSSQRRNQKVIEETPPIGVSSKTLKNLEECAVKLAESVRYLSAGTVEFLYDEDQEDFFFLEVNTRLQVEHGVTEMVCGIDLVEWMIRLAAGDRTMFSGTANPIRGHAAQARIYAENPARNFEPCTGTITKIRLPNDARWDGWIEEGTEVSPFYDPLLGKVLVHGKDRKDAGQKLWQALAETEIHGIRTNLKYLEQWVGEVWSEDMPVHTRSLENFSYRTETIEVLRGGTQTTIQDYPGRLGFWEVGVPPSGPVDGLSFRLANRIVGNRKDAAGLEITAYGPKLKFNRSSKLAICGASGEFLLNGHPVPHGKAFKVAEGDELDLGRIRPNGLRAYLAISGGFEIPDYLGSKSTFTLGKFGGHCGRPLRTGDHLVPEKNSSTEKPLALELDGLPDISNNWTLRTLYGPHGAPDFFTSSYMRIFFTEEWEVHYNSDRTGIRLLGPKPEWARTDGGEAGLHPSNLHDNPYAVGAVDFTGDIPVILGPDGPSLGGFVCPTTVASADLWKLGQLKPGDKIRFELINHQESLEALADQDEWLVHGQKPPPPPSNFKENFSAMECILKTGENHGDSWVIRQSGDQNLLIELGDPVLDLRLRFKIHLLHQRMREERISGIIDLTPGIRTLQVHYRPKAEARERTLNWIVSQLNRLEVGKQKKVPSRIVRLPLSWDDPSTRLATEKYQQSVRPDAPWCPDNIEFIRRVNGLPNLDEVKTIAYGANYVVLGLGDVYLGAPVATPLDPRHRLVTTKYNPARTWTPENAVGIGGAYLCVYGMEGPGGYQLIGRTLQMWNRYGKTDAFAEGKPWLLRFFDQIRFYPVSPEEMEEIRRDFPLGRYALRTEETIFDLEDYEKFLEDHSTSIAEFKTIQSKAFEEERSRWEASEVETPDEQQDYHPIHADELPAGTLGVESMVSGNLWKWRVSEGEQVKSGQCLAIIESMKMEISLESPNEGSVHSLLKSEGQRVSPGENLLLIATTS